MIDPKSIAAAKPILSLSQLSCSFNSAGRASSCSYCADPQAELERNVCPRCGSVHALRDVSLEVYPGEIVGIVGESGSGKSTLMRCVCFDQPANSGAVTTSLVDDGQTNLLHCSPRQKRQIRNTLFGMVYQNPYLGLRMDLSALSNIAEQMIASGCRNVEQMRQRGHALLERVNIPLSRAGDAPRLFSGGMQQRVQIAKALSNNPPILLLDEVTTGLDLSVQATVLDLIMQLRRDLEISMLIVSHDLRVIRMLAQRSYVLLNGRVVEHGLTDQILEDPQHCYSQQLVHSLL
ncbi:MAG: ATP-binding cassette domain-containing protein [Coriobacteriales bacterium]|jgi:putative phosphonate transport system ATP-binding protein|nr:ATP-binding cassette domain-containing protein [Coriobacteriales bacterium]